MKKIFTLLTLLLCTVIINAGDVFYIKFQSKTEITESPEGYFTYDKGEGTAVSWSSKGKHSCTYDGETYSDVIKMESATQAYFTSTAKATVTIVQTTSNATGDKLKFDGKNLDANLQNTTVTVNSDDKCNVYVITNVEAGKHTITRQSETGLAYIKVEYTGTVLTTLSTPEITADKATGLVTIGAVEHASAIKYTTDGSVPSAENGETYEAPFTVEDGVTVKAIAIGDGEQYASSEIATLLVLLDNVTLETPTFKTFNGTVELSCATPNTTIVYSIDGGTTWNEYGYAFTLTEDATVKARAKRGESVSEVASEDVTTVSKGAATKTICMGFDSFTVDSEHKYIMTGKEGSDAYGYTLTIDNTSKSWSELTGATISVGEISGAAIKLSNGAKNTLALPEGVKATRITLYSVINSAEARTSYWKEFNGTSYSENDVPVMGAWNTVTDRLTNPDTRVFPLTGEETEITFTNTGEQLGFIIALDIIESEATVTLAPAKTYTTLTSDKNLDFTNVDGLSAYIVKEEDVTSSNVKLTQVYKVPANTGLVLQKTGTKASYSVPVFDGTGADDVSLNKMVGSATEPTPIAANAGYILKDGKFSPSSEGTLPAGKAYLAVAVLTPGAKDLNIVFGEGTGINNVNTNENESGKIFNLAGQQMKSALKGVYIKNGKKYIK